ncbi:MAG: dehydrogenase, partial [Planctomycetota bacterium]|nr:dehydrogenase [Planctomycetota bacterium]
MSFRLEPGLRIELVAAEPMIESPVAMAFDERGRLFVAENRGYPTGPTDGAAPLGRIALLTDTDSDGDMDTRTTFAEDLSYPNGLLPWNGGLIVTCAPEILFLRDTDGDGKADEREVWFTGFSTAGSTQLRVSHPTFGPDNWIYVTSGLTGGKVTNPQAPDRPAIELGRTDFRFRPDRTAWEAIDGGAQFGQTFDDFGRRFICYNRVQAQHVVLTSAILRRQPKLTFSETVQTCPADMVAEPSRGHGTAARLFPISSNVTTADSHAGTFTAACGVTVFRGDSLPPGYQGGIFSCDPTGNLVHFDRLEPNGATFAARRARDGQEFLASTDNWFRPVYLAHGPDGALYVCDMYRKTIEHPDYLPVEVRKHTDFNSGKDKGRIWRVVASDATPADLTARRRLPLAELPVGGLLPVLEEQNGWRRETARRLLATKIDDGSREALRKVATDPAAAGPALVCAVSLLDARNAVDDGVLDFLIAHPEPAIRELALRLAEPRLVENPHLLEHVLTLTGDDNPRVRFQSAIALGACAASKVDQNDRLRRDAIPSRLSAALAKLGARDGADRWTRAAVLSATAGREEAVFVALLTIARDKATVSEAF